jgi:hypothetical protein
MPRPFADIAADFDALAASDFDLSAEGIDRISQLCEEFEALGSVDRCAPVLFHTIERLDRSDLGDPGPLVHTLESWRGAYEPYLRESIHRKPTYLTVWMINRILNADPPDADEWLELLKSVLDHPRASAGATTAARFFLEDQARM